MATYKHLNEKEFTQIQKLLDLDLRQKNVADLVKRSLNVITLVKQSKDFAEYKQRLHALYGKYHKPKTAPKSGTVSTERTVNSKEYSTTNELRIMDALERIAESLELMEGHWRPISEKKRFKIF